MQTKKPNWLQQREKQCAKTGTLSFRQDLISDLSIITPSPLIKVLDVSFCPVESLEGLPNLQHLNKFIANNSGLQTFTNFEAVSTASTVDLSNTPLSSQRNYRLTCSLIFSGLKTLDGRMVPSAIKAKAETYSQNIGLVRKMIFGGWHVVYPCPSDEKLRVLASEYINKRKQKENETTKEESHCISEITEPSEESLDYSSNESELSLSINMEPIENKENKQKSLRAMVYDTMKKYGLQPEKKDQYSIMEVLERLIKEEENNKIEEDEEQVNNE